MLFMSAEVGRELSCFCWLLLVQCGCCNIALLSWPEGTVLIPGVPVQQRLDEIKADS